MRVKPPPMTPATVGPRHYIGRTDNGEQQGMAQDRDQVIEGVIRNWRESLINLTGRNRLLNFTVTKTSTVPVTVPATTDVLARLQQLRAGTSLTLQPLRPPPSQAEAEAGDDLVLLDTAARSADADWVDPQPRVLSDASTLGANMDPAALRGALRNLLARSNQTFMDTGLWTLYMAFGTLTWTDPEDPKTRFRSPLVLVPVVLTSTGPRTTPLLRLGEEDAVVNPALTLKMQTLGVEIPEIDLEEDGALDTYLQSLSRVVSRKDGWSVEANAHLSYFTFHKEAMYRDLLDNIDAILASEQVLALAGSGLTEQTDSMLFDPTPDDRIDELDPPESAMQVMDADSSQRAAIRAAADGKSFVIDGPPGTGKSQTIANIIATLIPQGKSVLFVSEKAAALEVVKNRLEDVGLGNYVLELHSHKATRKEVAEELARAVTSRPKAPTTLTPTALEQLRKTRLQLSRYAAEMNRPHEPLGMTPHDAIGLVSRHEDLPAVQRCTGSLIQMTAADLAGITDAAHRLASAWRPAQQGEHFVWRDVTQHTPLTYELTQARDALSELRDVMNGNAAVTTAMGWHRPSDGHHLDAALALWAQRPERTPAAWLSRPTFAEIETAAADLTSRLIALREAEATADATAGDRWPSLAHQLTPSDLQEAHDALAHLHPTPADTGTFTADELRRSHDHVAELSARAQVVLDTAETLAPRLGLLVPGNLAEAAAVVEVERLSRRPHRAEPQWLRAEVDADVQTGLDALKTANEAVAQAKQQAEQFFNAKVLELDPEALQSRFLNVHTGLHKLGGAYRADVRALGEASTPGIKGKRNIANLPAAVAWQAAIAQRGAVEDRYSALIGPRYRREDTDWTGLYEALDNARAVVKAARTSVIDQLANAVGQGGHPDPRNQGDADTIDAHLAQIADWALSTDRPLISDPVVDQPLAALLAWAQSAATALLAIEEDVRQTERTLALGRVLTVAETQLCVQVSAAASEARAGFADGEAAWSSVLAEAYQGRDTRLDHLQTQIAWTRQLRQLATDTVPGTEAGAFTDDQVKALESSLPSPALAPSLRDHMAALQAVLDAFHEQRRGPLRQQLDSWDDGHDLLGEMLGDSVGQDEWFAYTEAREHLEAWGLAGTIDSAAAARVPASDVAALVQRETLRRWTDEVIDTRPELQSARRNDRDALVAEFQRLDSQLVKSTVGRVIEQANTYRPTSTVGQAGIIVNEGRKKKRHMPIRELISRTPDVSLAVKPVFMMSPLSVSQYLPADIRFDVVIFDEASQVMPEDAVNCIYRGRSLIIAGDERQLPPTNFFALGSADEDESWEADQSSAKDFESVLSIAKGCGAFTSMTLNWHYRSRHEALIAFSNSRFYNGGLVTFPSAQAEGPDVGVEFFLVPDGQYDRGGSRRNLPEARFVARRIAHHYDTRPGMSLGVVAFSQPQADAIQLALDELILDRPDLEAHLHGSRLDALFIKNLETVQGDERDVMLFSVGYGPDQTGKLTMNFGPINRDGGWRRLNVAVTRARFRNEVIASFAASQMNASSQRSVNEFRRYLDYAANGLSALALDDAESLGDVESPFEESVVSWLRSEGYHVTTQVGSSGYRIDMAVHHPEHPSRFVIGIECDGVQYHSSQTARDRDRLRDQVLTGLGWKLHRIWGTAWYRHRQAEQQRLRDAIDEAIAAPPRGLLPRIAVQTRLPLAEIEVEEVELGSVAEWAVPYVRATAPSAPHYISPSEPESIRWHAEIIKAVVKVESPVHMDLVDRHLREAWGIGAIGKRIRAMVDTGIMRADVRRDGEFLLAQDAPDTFPTRMHDADTKRDIRHVYFGELEETAYRVVRDAGAISLDALVISTARHLGFARVGEDVRAAITMAIRSLEEVGWISDDDDERIRVLAVPEQ